MSVPVFESYSDYKKNWQPYDSPVQPSLPPELQPPAAAAVATEESPIAFFAAFLLFLGYLATNVMLIDDIYCGQVGAEGRIGRSPFTMLNLSRADLTRLYAVGSLVTIAGAVVVACRKMPSYGGIILIMCPLVLLVNFIGSLLRDSGILTRYLACAYLFCGVYLVGTAALYFWTTSAPLIAVSPSPTLNSMALQGGATLMIIAILRLRKE